MELRTGCCPSRAPIGPFVACGPDVHGWNAARFLEQSNPLLEGPCQPSCRAQRFPRFSGPSNRCWTLAVRSNGGSRARSNRQGKRRRVPYRKRHPVALADASFYANQLDLRCAEGLEIALRSPYFRQTECGTLCTTSAYASCCLARQRTLQAADNWSILRLTTSWISAKDRASIIVTPPICTRYFAKSRIPSRS